MFFTFFTIALMLVLCTVMCIISLDLAINFQLKKREPQSRQSPAVITYLQQIEARCRRLFEMDFEVGNALRFVRERVADTGSDIHHVAAEINFMREAAAAALADIEAEVERYKQNLKILLQEFEKKQADHAATAASSGRAPPHVEPLVYHCARDLREAVEAMEDVEYRAGYDAELTQYWHRYGGCREATKYEELWVWVQGRRMPSMD